MNATVRLAGIALGLAVAGQAWAVPFRFVALPDTQIYSENIYPGTPNRPPVTDPNGTGHIFGDQTQWIVDNAAALNIRYVGHLGDIVQNGDDPSLAPAEWARAKDAMNKLLDAGIPHGTVMGNHDDSHTGGYQSDYLANFGPQVFAGQSWYTGSSPTGGGNFVLLEHEGQKIGFLNFSIDQPRSEVDWAKQVINDHPDTIFVIGTHRYLYDYKLIAGRYNEVNVTPLGTFQINEGPEAGVVDPVFGQQLFEEVINPNPNVMMIHAGHFHSEWIRITDRPNMEKVVEMLTDYQDARNGGDGWLRLYTMDLENNTFSWETYSPTLDENRTTLHHFIETIAQAYQQRDAVKSLLGFPDDATYLAWLNANLKNTPAPDGFLALHPDWDANYYMSYLSDMFDVPNGGTIPLGFENPLEWEALWFAAFAGDQTAQDPFGFASGYRSPSGSISLNFDAFVVPEPMTAALGLMSLAGLTLALRRRTSAR